MKNQWSRFRNFFSRYAYPSGITASDAGLVRILFFSIVLLTTTNERLADFARLSADLYCAHTNGSWTYLTLSSSAISWVMNAYRLSLICAIIGFLTPAAYWMSFLTAGILNLSAVKFCYFDHRSLPLQLAFVFWALLDQNSAFRLDSFIFKKKTPGQGDPPFLFQVMRIHFCLVFFAAGYSKLKYGGFDWITSDSLWSYLALQNFYFEGNFSHSHFAFLNHFLIRHPILCNLMALETVLIELLVPLALYRSRWTRGFVWNLFLMQVGIFLVMFFTFFPWAALYLFWIPDEGLESAFAFLRRPRAGAGAGEA